MNLVSFFKITLNIETITKTKNSASSTNTLIHLLALSNKFETFDVQVRDGMSTLEENAFLNNSKLVEIRIEDLSIVNVHE